MISNQRRSKYFSFIFLNLGKGLEERPEQTFTEYPLHSEHVLGKICECKTSLLPHYKLMGVGIIIPLYAMGKLRLKEVSVLPKDMQLASHSTEALIIQVFRCWRTRGEEANQRLIKPGSI